MPLLCVYNLKEDTEMLEDLIFENIGKLTIALIIGLVFLTPVIGEAECSAKTEGMGFKHEWTFFGGCRIEHKKGAWIPLERYRVLED